MGGIRKDKKKETESVAASLCGYVRQFLHMILCLYLTLLLVVMPYYYTEGYSRIGTDKFLFFRRWSLNIGKIFLPFLALYLVLEGILCWQNRIGKPKEAGKRKVSKAIPKLSVTDGFALLYGAALLLSYGFSQYKEQAKWGAQGWYMGLYTHLILLAVYFFVSRFWRCRKWLPAAGLLASAGVFALGYLNRFGIFPIPMGDFKNYDVLYISTVGNINWFCGYLVCLLFPALALFWQGGVLGKVKKALLAAYFFLGFAAFLVQGSSSGYLALAAVFLVFFCFSDGEWEFRKRLWELVFLFSAAAIFTFLFRRFLPFPILYSDGIMDWMTLTAVPFLMMGFSILAFWLEQRNFERTKKQTFFSGRILTGIVLGLLLLYLILLVWNTLTSGALSFLPQELFTFHDDWGSKRGATWRAGVICFWEQDFLHKWVGVGPDSMYMHLYFSGNTALAERMQENFGSAILTNAHCEWLTVLVDTGILGLAGFAGMMGSAVFRFWRARKEKHFAGACGVGILAYTFNNIFSFQQIMSVAMIFVILGMGEAHLRELD